MKNEAETYGDNLDEIREAIMGLDYFKTILKLQEIALRLANENFRLRMDLAMQRPTNFEQFGRDTMNTKPTWTARNSEEFETGGDLL